MSTRKTACPSCISVSLYLCLSVFLSLSLSFSLSLSLCLFLSLISAIWWFICNESDILPQVRFNTWSMALICTFYGFPWQFLFHWSTLARPALQSSAAFSYAFFSGSFCVPKDCCVWPFSRCHRIFIGLVAAPSSANHHDPRVDIRGVLPAKLDVRSGGNENNVCFHFRLQHRFLWLCWGIQNLLPLSIFAIMTVSNNHSLDGCAIYYNARGENKSR